MNDRRPDDELKNSLNQLYDNIEIPDCTASWSKVQATLERSKRRRRWCMRIGSVAAALMLLLAIGLNTNVTGVYSFNSLFKNIQNAMVEIFHDRLDDSSIDDANTPPPEQPAGPSSDRKQPKEVTLEEALQHVSYLQIPTSVPDRFTIKRIRLFQTYHDHDQYDNVVIEYSGPEGESIRFTQRLLSGASGAIKSEVSVNAGEYQDVNINGSPGIMLIPTTGNLHLEWLTKDRIFTQIIGTLSVEEIIHMAKSVKRAAQ